ncbi:substrate-binding domain-containing protein [Niveibacterium sp. 24ML]|uniref:substrate-binding domain-containing protein n=1 Tax=Niveibacterium sp. 24ML TaxID=2985512 RepID=UPI00226F5800|nr:substrate-binding domain-containing protein [Niveibacterium sp. 24ML]MCX9155978.1 substrate-binding domain-containing protein [Niveibacterium sp. 24ML]
MKLLRLISAVLLGLSLFACSDSSGPSITTTASSGPADKSASPVAAKPRVGLVMKTLTNPFFVEMEKGARRAESELGIELLVKTAAQETSIEQQILLVNDLTAAKVDAIVIAPGDSQRLIPALKKAADAGIKIVNIDNRLDAQAVKQAGLAPVPFVSVDNHAGAYKAARFLVQDVSAPTQAAIIEGIRSADNARQRMEGARRGLLENKAVTVVASETANWKIDEAYEVSKAIFAKHPQVKIVFAANDMMALGVLKYLQDSKREGVKLAGYDALAEALAEVKAGRLTATVDQQAAEQGFQGVALALKLARGEAVPPETVIDTRLVTAAAQP